MKLKTTLLLLSSCLMLAFASGCKKRDCVPCGDSYKIIPQEMRDWALFEEGSWWVYRLAEDTTVFDTVRFSSKSDFRSNKWTCHDNNSLSIQCSETITYKLQHSNKQYFVHPFDSTKTVSDEINLYYPPGGGVCLLYNNGAATGTSGRLFCIEPIITGEYYGNFTLIDTLLNFSKNGIYTKQAFYSDITKNYVPESGSYRKVYWGKNTGLLSIEITHYSNGKTKNWELINYEVKQ